MTPSESADDNCSTSFQTEPHDGFGECLQQFTDLIKGRGASPFWAPMGRRQEPVLRWQAKQPYAEKEEGLLQRPPSQERESCERPLFCGIDWPDQESPDTGCTGEEESTHQSDSGHWPYSKHAYVPNSHKTNSTLHSGEVRSLTHAVHKQSNQSFSKRF